MPDRSRLKLMILSCPKTGNAWLRQLLHYAYGVPIVDLPAVWSDSTGQSLPEAFVGHQHFAPTERVVRWIAENDVTVLTTIRHPGDTLLSYFHYARWQEADRDPSFSQLRSDGTAPGNAALGFAAGGFAQAYAVSLNWARLGAIVVRYEDLVRDPVSTLGALVARIGRTPVRATPWTALLCQPRHMTQSGAVDSRHIRTGRSGVWQEELGDEFIDVLAESEPFRTACVRYDYNWDRTAAPPPKFDYATLDPFAGRDRFDNGVPIVQSVEMLYFKDGDDAVARWPDPCRTEGDSYWNWLTAPAAEGGSRTDLPGGTYTNLMAAIYRTRSDLQAAFPDPVGADRIAYVEWFLGQAISELGLPWMLVMPVVDAYGEQLARVACEAALCSQAPEEGQCPEG